MFYRIIRHERSLNNKSGRPYNYTIRSPTWVRHKILSHGHGITIIMCSGQTVKWFRFKPKFSNNRLNEWNNKIWHANILLGINGQLLLPVVHLLFYLPHVSLIKLDQNNRLEKLVLFNASIIWVTEILDRHTQWSTKENDLGLWGYEAVQYS